MSFSTNLTRAFNARESGECLILLMTFSHPSQATPIRVSNDPTTRVVETTSELVYGTVSRGNTFIYIPFTYKPPSEMEDGPSTSFDLVLEDVGLEFIESLRTLPVDPPPSVLIECVLASAPDYLEKAFPLFDLSTWSAKAADLTLTLAIRNYTNEPCPGRTFNQAHFPGLF